MSGYDVSASREAHHHTQCSSQTLDRQYPCAGVLARFAAVVRLTTNSARWDESGYNTTAQRSRSINQGGQRSGLSVLPLRRAMWAEMVRCPVGDDRGRKGKYGSLRFL
jgi:hypothetical protein